MKLFLITFLLMFSSLRSVEDEHFTCYRKMELTGCVYRLQHLFAQADPDSSDFEEVARKIYTEMNIFKSLVGDVDDLQKQKNHKSNN